MAFTNHQITAFQKKLTDLPDQPNLSAAELKAYFDSSPEELRQALNGVCTDAERLDSRVSGIVAEMFGDTIPKTMLSTELQAEIDAKAEQTENETAHAALQTAIAAKCAAYLGQYTGNSPSGKNLTQTVTLGFAPLAVLVFPSDGRITDKSYNSPYGGLFFAGHPLYESSHPDDWGARVTETGFEVRVNSNAQLSLNTSGRLYYYLALR